MRLAPRLAWVAAAGVTCAAALTGCLNVNPQSSQQDIRVTSGEYADAGDLAIRGVLIVPQADGAADEVTGTVYNGGSEDDALTGITVAGKPATLTGGASIPAGASLRLGSQALSGVSDSVTATVSGGAVPLGTVAEVVMTFQRAPAATMNVLALQTIAGPTPNTNPTESGSAGEAGTGTGSTAPEPGTTLQPTAPPPTAASS